MATMTAMATIVIHILLSSSTVAEVDDWRAAQRPLPNRSEAIRQLLEIGLSTTKEGKPDAQNQGHRGDR
jgi:metal-responsive CopG/Arc/MetJ family transcriptional regulator